MIVTGPRGAIVTNPAHSVTPLIGPRHQVDLLKPNGKRFARLYGDDREQLAERACRWRAHVDSKLTLSGPEP